LTLSFCTTYCFGFTATSMRDGIASWRVTATSSLPGVVPSGMPTIASQ
jgi:hypothetical protein